jgi:hypothetical protein
LALEKGEKINEEPFNASVCKNQTPQMQQHVLALYFNPSACRIYKVCKVVSYKTGALY